MTYRLAKIGVIEIATGARIRRSDPGWADYAAWLKAGGVPAPAVVDLEPLADIAARLHARIKQARNRGEQSGFPYMGAVFDSDQTSAVRIANAAAGAVAAISAAVPYEIEWTAADNTGVPMTAQDVAGMPLALAGHASAWHQAARAKKDEVQALLDAGDRAGLGSYDVTAGWPEEAV